MSSKINCVAQTVMLCFKLVLCVQFLCVLSVYDLNLSRKLDENENSGVVANLELGERSKVLLPLYLLSLSLPLPSLLLLPCPSLPFFLPSLFF